MKDRIYLYPGTGEGEPHYLDRLGTIEDLASTGKILEEGMTVQFWTDDADEAGDTDNLLFEGIVHFDATCQKWYAMIDHKSFRHESDKD